MVYLMKPELTIAACRGLYHVSCDRLLSHLASESHFSHSAGDRHRPRSRPPRVRRRAPGAGRLRSIDRSISWRNTNGCSSPAHGKHHAV